MVNRMLGTLSLLFLVLFSITGVASDLSRLHPTLRQWIDLSSGEAAARGLPAGDVAGMDSLQVGISPTGTTWIRVLVRTSEPIGTSSFLGVPIGFSQGGISSLYVTAADLARLASDDRVIYVEPSWRARPQLDESVPAVGGDELHASVPAVLGEGVILGFVDTGIDYEHLDFRYDANRDGVEESSRILAIWDQTYGFLGATYDQDEIESDLALGFGPGQGLVRERDQDGHGTHVASIAAGDGSSSRYGFVGMAPSASIVAVKTTFYTADILDAVEYVFDVADRVGLPAVVNLSLGGHEGPHDGTSLFEQGLSALAAAGRIIVVSAGNEGDQTIHVSGALQGGARKFYVVPEDWEIELDLWYPGASRFGISVTSPSGQTIVVPTGNSSGYVMTADGIIHVDNASGGVNPNNRDREAIIRLSNTLSGDSWAVTVADLGGGGSFDAWVTTASGYIVGGDSASTIDEPGNARGVITVGSFNTKSRWPSKAGEQDFSAKYPLHVLSSFSSQGPTRDGRTKPEICAPGAWVCAALSASAAGLSYLVHPDEVHTMELGTSMAAPHVSGAVALLLSVAPTLSTDAVRSLLTSTAIRDSYTGAIPNMRWGWGKLSAVAAVENVEPVEPPPGEAEVPELAFVQNPAGSVETFLYTLPAGTTTATLRVYSASGVRVFEAPLSVSSDKYTWDLRSDQGSRLAAGLYLVVIVTDRGTSAVGRLVILPS